MALSLQPTVFKVQFDRLKRWPRTARSNAELRLKYRVEHELDLNQMELKLLVSDQHEQ